MSEGSLRSRFTHNVAKSVVGEDELREHLRAADCVYLLLSAVHVTRDASLLDRYAGQVGSPAVFRVFSAMRDPRSPAEGRDRNHRRRAPS